MESGKENILTSVRFWSAMAGVLVSLILKSIDFASIGKTPEDVRSGILAIGLIIGSYVVGRGIRNDNGIRPEPERYYRSMRFWNMVAGVGLVVGFLAVDVRAVGIGFEEIESVLYSIGILSATLIHSRTIRNIK